jgi:hypothetical protein
MPDDEVFVPGLFAEPYVAKEYPYRLREVLTTLIQLLAAETDTLGASHVALIGDDELRAWLLAVLAEVGSE